MHLEKNNKKAFEYFETVFYNNINVKEINAFKFDTGNRMNVKEISCNNQGFA